MTLAIWVWFRTPHDDGGQPVLRVDTIAAALADMREADPLVTGGALLLDDGEHLVFEPRASAAQSKPWSFPIIYDLITKTKVFYFFF